MRESDRGKAKEEPGRVVYPPPGDKKQALAPPAAGEGSAPARCGGQLDRILRRHLGGPRNTRRPPVCVSAEDLAGGGVDEVEPRPVVRGGLRRCGLRWCRLIRRIVWIVHQAVLWLVLVGVIAVG